MDICVQKASLFGTVQTPGSKSHTIRSLILAALAEGDSEIENPLAGADCFSAAAAIEHFGAKADCSGPVWKVQGAGKNLHLPDDVINVGNSGSVLYFLSPIAAVFAGWSIFTGDESIRTRPVSHLADLLNQAGAKTHISRPDCDAPPLLIQGPIRASVLRTDGRLSQYISGMMMAAPLLDGTTRIMLSDPKESPYLTMTKNWLEGAGIPVKMSSDFKSIEITGPKTIRGFKVSIPSDWEAAAFPLIAALLSDSKIFIEQVDLSGSQGDDAIVGILQAVGADLQLNSEAKNLRVCGGKRLAIKGGKQRINCSGFPDAVCALATIACFIEGTTILEDIAVCRRKETDRIAVMASELSKLGAVLEEGSDFLVIHGHSPLLADGQPNPHFALHGASVETYKDHRVAMALAAAGLGLPSGEKLIVRGMDCCSVSFPGFIDTMNKLGAGFIEKA